MVTKFYEEKTFEVESNNKTEAKEAVKEFFNEKDKIENITSIRPKTFCVLVKVYKGQIGDEDTEDNNKA